MRPVWLVTLREVRARAQTRSFVVSTALIAVISIGLVAASALLPDFFEDAPGRIGVVAEPASTLPAALERTAEQSALETTVTRTASVDEGLGALREGDIDALLIEDQRKLIFESELSAVLQALTTRALFEVELPRHLSSLGLTAEDVQPLVEPEPAIVELLDPVDDAGASDAERVVAELSALILFAALALYGNWVLLGVIEEKTNRVIELLVSAVRPSHLIAGKVLGIVTVACGQLFVGIGFLTVALLTFGKADIPELPVVAIAVSVPWLILGLLFYSFGYAAVGATVARQSEASSAVWPLMMLLLVPYGASLILIPEDPDGLVARVLSLLPVSSPLAMPARYAHGDPAPWEFAFAVILMLPSIAGIAWFGGRVYAGAILNTGRRVGLAQAFRAGRETI